MATGVGVKRCEAVRFWNTGGGDAATRKQPRRREFWAFWRCGRGSFREKDDGLLPRLSLAGGTRAISLWSARRSGKQILCSYSSLSLASGTRAVSGPLWEPNPRGEPTVFPGLEAHAGAEPVRRLETQKEVVATPDPRVFLGVPTPHLSTLGGGTRPGARKAARERRRQHRLHVRSVALPLRPSVGAALQDLPLLHDGFLVHDPNQQRRRRLRVLGGRPRVVAPHVLQVLSPPFASPSMSMSAAAAAVSIYNDKALFLLGELR